jgi:DNA polymerase IV
VDAYLEHIVHLDMDAFFVEVERLRNPALRGKSVVVGGIGNRGVVASASYEARRRGVRSGMPMAHARRLVPEGSVVPPDHASYRAVSEQVFAVLDDFSPAVSRISVDEAFVEIGGLRLHYASPVACGEAMRSAIRQELNLPASVGVATTRLVAKMASRDAKPDGLHFVSAGSELEYLHPKAVRSLWGVGEATLARLEELGIATIGDIAAFPSETLTRRLGSALGGMLWNVAHGRDDPLAGGGPVSHSISVEQTFEVDLVTIEDMDRELLGQADRLTARLRRAGFLATTIGVKVRYPDFSTVSRSHTFAEPVSTSVEIYDTARQLLRSTDAQRRGVRLVGLAGDGLVPLEGPRQLGLGDTTWEEIDEVMEDVRTRFGNDAVSRARLADPDHPIDPAASRQ